MDSPPSDSQLYEDAKRLAKILVPYGLPYHDKEDVVQEIAIALIEARKRFDPLKASWKTYSWIRAKGAITDFLRKNVIDQVDYQRSDGSKIRHTSYELRLHEIPIYEEYDALYYHEFLKTLPLRERLLVVCLLKGHSLGEVARMLNISVGRASAILGRLRIVNMKSLYFAAKE